MPLNGSTRALGGGQGAEMSYPVVIEEMFNIAPDTIDIREDSLAKIKEDYLLFDINKFDYKHDIIITNPPFCFAPQIIPKALADVKTNGYVIMLLRLNYWGSKERNQWLKDNMPKYCFIHGKKRMSFTKNGGTDSIEYAHFCWQVGYKPKETITILL